ncbi:MAG: alpha-ketoglutarate-dependent dioxygenase AlkB [Acidobacteria bacterium]|nr:alpha-ketoglutarate-dependent dioxygenase AlkB [Acidobacteriota bacterium]
MRKVPPVKPVAGVRSIKAPDPPDGFRYQEDFLTGYEEACLASFIASQPLKEFEFYGYLGKRRVFSFGWRYDQKEGRVKHSREIPEELIPLRDKVSNFASIAPAHLSHILLTEYTPGTPIGWHRDRPAFDEVIGISLLSECSFRMRRRTREGWERFTQILRPRSIYMMGGAARRLWEHSIPPVERLRYSITFRTLRQE